MIGFSLSGCFDAALRDQTSLTSVSLSQTNEIKTAGRVKTNCNNLSSFFDITYFNFDSAELNVGARNVLDRAVDKFLTNPPAHVVISELEDERETREYNLALGHLRESAVADYMVDRGIDNLGIKNLLW